MDQCVRRVAQISVEMILLKSDENSERKDGRLIAAFAATARFFSHRNTISFTHETQLPEFSGNNWCSTSLQTNIGVPALDFILPLESQLYSRAKPNQKPAWWNKCNAKQSQ